MVHILVLKINEEAVPYTSLHGRTNATKIYVVPCKKHSMQ